MEFLITDQRTSYHGKDCTSVSYVSIALTTVKPPARTTMIKTISKAAFANVLNSAALLRPQASGANVGVGAARTAHHALLIECWILEFIAFEHCQYATLHMRGGNGTGAMRSRTDSINIQIRRHCREHTLEA